MNYLSENSEIRNEIIARHKRSYTSANFVFNPLHFLPLLQQKVGALDQAAPLLLWDLLDGCAALHRELGPHMGELGKQEYVKVFDVLETFVMSVLQGAIPHAINVGALAPTP